MQQPTIAELRVRTTADALIIVHAVRHDMLPMVRRRLDADERRSIKSGDVFVWEERCNAEPSGLGIERWTDSIRWGPSRTRDDFLYYNERRQRDSDVTTSSCPSDTSSNRRPLIKQTYSVYLHLGTGPRRRTKWHLIAYFTQNTLDQLRTIDDYPQLVAIQVPDGAYKCARHPKRPSREMNSLGKPLLHHPYLYQTRDANSQEDAIPEDGNHREKLAPLQYLQAIPPRRRHVVDEMALIQLSKVLDFSSSHALQCHLSCA
jgi:hypothetical protein